MGITGNLIQTSRILGEDLSQSSQFPSKFFTRVLDQDLSPIYTEDLTPNYDEDLALDCTQGQEEDTNNKRKERFS